MSSEETLIQIRREKHQELNGGAYPLAEFRPPIANVRSLFNFLEVKTSLDPSELSESDVGVHGRITNFRKSGALTFIKVSDQSGSIQIIATRNATPNYETLRLLDLGDIVDFTGKLCMSKTGEQSILLSAWQVLTKAHRPPPEKHFGISDQELKYRKRHLDLMSDEETRARFVVRSLMLRCIRYFMEDHHFLEVETSTLNTVSSGANAKPFTTHHNALEMDLFLRIAPELYLKRLLVGGYEKVFEIGRNYRNEGISTRHNPEFTMMEFYQAYGKFSELLDFTQRLLSSTDDAISELLELQDYVWVRPHYSEWRKNRTFSLRNFEFKRVRMEDAVHYACYKMDGRPSADFSHIERLALENERFLRIDIKSMTHELSLAQSSGQRMAIMFEYLAEPFLTEDYRSQDGTQSAPVFITDYPKEICPLARSNDKDPEVCDRFELFVDGRELANAFQELNDPQEQALRFREQAAARDAMDIDMDYVEALEQGMPPAIGFGMGVDRLAMLLTNAVSIKDVILFPTLKTLK